MGICYLAVKIKLNLVSLKRYGHPDIKNWEPCITINNFNHKYEESDSH